MDDLKLTLDNIKKLEEKINKNKIKIRDIIFKGKNNNNFLKLYDYNVLLLDIDNFIKNQELIWDYKNKSIDNEVVRNMIYILHGSISQKKIDQILFNIVELKKKNFFLKEENNKFINKIKLIQELYSITNFKKGNIDYLYKLLNQSFISLIGKNKFSKKDKLEYKKNIFIITDDGINLYKELSLFHVVYKKKRKDEETKPCLNKNTCPCCFKSKHY